MTRLLIDNACRALVLRVASHTDANEPALLAALFTEDAVLVRPNKPPILGRAAIESSYTQNPVERITRHLVTNTLVEVESADAARARSCVLVWAGSKADDPGPYGRAAHSRQLLGEFDDRFCLTSSGWRIARREAHFVLYAGG